MRLHQNLSRTMMILAAILPLAGSLSGCSLWESAQEKTARQTLDSLLGQESPPHASPASPQELEPNPHFPLGEAEPVDPFDGFPRWLTQGLPGQPQVEVEETTDSYRIRIKLGQPKDADSIQLNVQPHRVEISGQSSYGGRSGFSGSTTFMKAFSTQSELLPSQVRRERNDQELLVIIPKKFPNASVQKPSQKHHQSTTPSENSHPGSNGGADPVPLSPDALRQLEQTQTKAI